MSHNCLSQLCDLSSLTALTRLYLDENGLTELPARLLPSSLRSLSASSNRIAAVSDLRCLAQLTDLRLASNRLTELGWLAGVASLSRLSVAGNRLCSLQCLNPLRFSIDSAECESV